MYNSVYMEEKVIKYFGPDEVADLKEKNMLFGRLENF